MIKQIITIIITKLVCTFNVSEKTPLELCPFYCQPNYDISKQGLDHAIADVKTTSDGSRGVAKGAPLKP